VWIVARAMLIQCLLKIDEYVTAIAATPQGTPVSANVAANAGARAGRSAAKPMDIFLAWVKNNP
jgi:hypothetical protein